jgi:hypothetical protein
MSRFRLHQNWGRRNKIAPAAFYSYLCGHITINE